ncbi:hypothetical protein KIPB_012589, partial [Kipferlia bialata]|eukprot:g12589.t1
MNPSSSYVFDDMDNTPQESDEREIRFNVIKKNRRGTKQIRGLAMSRSGISNLS